MEMTSGTIAVKERLARLYGEVSKHSGYQTIPDFVASTLGYQETIQSQWRGDRNRLDWILAHRAPRAGERWADFGANTGFFTYTIAHAYPDARVTAIEANAEHAKFLGELGDAFSIGNVDVHHEALPFDGLDKLSDIDVLLHLNVLHHAGADFDREHVTGAHDFPAYAVAYLKKLRSAARSLVFQLGCNLWGDKSHPLQPGATDAERLAYVSKLLTDAGWRIRDVAYARKTPDAPIAYADLGKDVIEALNGEHGERELRLFADALAPYALDQHIGEFYRRAIYIVD
jgi:hypothetical protein